MNKFSHIKVGPDQLARNFHKFMKKFPLVTDVSQVIKYFEWYVNHHNAEVSNAAKEVIQYYRKKTLEQLTTLDNREQWLHRQVMQAANNSNYWMESKSVA